MMNTQQSTDHNEQAITANENREKLLEGLPVTEHQIELAGISSAVLVGGEGPPVILLHGQGEFAAVWTRVIPDLLSTHRVVVPDLPGHGASEVGDSTLDLDHTLAWLGELVDRTCDGPPAVAGHLLGGAIAARFTGTYQGRLSRLVLVDTLGLAWYRPALPFVLAMAHFMARPTEKTQDRLLRRCMADLDGLREEMGGGMELLEAYALECARGPNVRTALRSLMPRLGMPPIPQADLARIDIPTSLIWGRHDLQVRLKIAEGASARYDWPLHVIENCADDPAVEQPEAFLKALNTVLETHANIPTGKQL